MSFEIEMAVFAQKQTRAPSLQDNMHKGKKKQIVKNYGQRRIHASQKDGMIKFNSKLSVGKSASAGRAFLGSHLQCDNE